jgi:hypothetical protein
MDLATKVAELQFKNRDFVLLFRGQPADYLNKQSNTSLRPSLFRAKGNGKVPTAETLTSRYEDLVAAEKRLVEEYERAELTDGLRLKRERLLRWSILQHYEVCPTPVLDVTHSLRVAASFATDGATGEAFIFVVGVPNLSGAITASSEAGLQIVRLSSICPPTAVRPHIQEGYLLGEYPEMAGFDQKEHYGFYEIDFGRRLVAKFRFDPQSFWQPGSFPPIGREALYPDEHDPLFRITRPIKKALEKAA